MSNKSEQLLRNALCAVNKVVGRFQKNPFHYLYESDIQSDLFAELRGNTRDCSIPLNFLDGGACQLTSIYTEYKIVDSSRDRIDIIGLDPDWTVHYQASLNKNKKDALIYNLHPVLLAIEIKYIWMTSMSGFNVLWSDYQKLTREDLKDSISNWLVLGFIQRKEEAEPFLKDREIFCEQKRLMRKECLNCVENFNEIYCITPKTILSAIPRG